MKYDELIRIGNELYKAINDADEQGDILGCYVRDGRLDILAAHTTVEEFAADFPNYELAPYMDEYGIFNRTIEAIVDGVRFHTYVRVEESADD